LCRPGSSTLFVMNQLGGALGVAVLTVLVDAWTAEVGTAPLRVPLGAAVAIAVAAGRIDRGQAARVA